MEERQVAYTVAEGFELPSGGQIYAKPVNPHVELRSMTAKDEMRRLNPSTTPLKNLADIIEDCMLEKPAIHVYDMALGDYEYLLHKLRIVTYGPDYKMSVICQNPLCGAEVNATVNLEELTVKEFDLTEYRNLCTFTLPVSGDVITIKGQTPHILDDISLKSKEMRRKAGTSVLDFETIAKLQNAIVSVNDRTPNSFEIETYVTRLAAKDLLKIEQQLNKVNQYLGIDTEIFLSCPKCSEEIHTFFRFGPEFFRPTLD